MQTALVFLIGFVAIATCQIQVIPPFTDSPPVVQPLCLPGTIRSYPDMVNCRRFHLCYDQTLYHMWCAPGRTFDSLSSSCLIGGQCVQGAFPIDLEPHLEVSEIENY